MKEVQNIYELPFEDGVTWIRNNLRLNPQFYDNDIYQKIWYTDTLYNLIGGLTTLVEIYNQRKDMIDDSVRNVVESYSDDFNYARKTMMLRIIENEEQILNLFRNNDKLIKKYIDNNLETGDDFRISNKITINALYTLFNNIYIEIFNMISSERDSSGWNTHYGDIKEAIRKCYNGLCSFETSTELIFLDWTNATVFDMMNIHRISTNVTIDVYADIDRYLSSLITYMAKDALVLTQILNLCYTNINNDLI
jgi:hypothetical protein